MKLIDKLKDEFPGLNENMLLQFIEEARKEVMKEDEQDLSNVSERRRGN
jgi:uncharacterized protein (DUF433 family)